MECRVAESESCPPQSATESCTASDEPPLVRLHAVGRKRRRPRAGRHRRMCTPNLGVANADRPSCAHSSPDYGVPARSLRWVTASRLRDHEPGLSRFACQVDRAASAHGFLQFRSVNVGVRLGAGCSAEVGASGATSRVCLSRSAVPTRPASSVCITASYRQLPAKQPSSLNGPLQLPTGSVNIASTRPPQIHRHPLGLQRAPERFHRLRPRH